MTDEFHPPDTDDAVQARLSAMLAAVGGEAGATAVGDEAFAFQVNTLQAVIDAAYRKNHARTAFPGRFSRLPLLASARVQAFLLRLYAYASKEQRALNFSMIHALKLANELNRDLVGQLASARQASARAEAVAAQALDAARQAVAVAERADKALGELAADRRPFDDAQYAQLEDRLRGHSTLVRERLAVYRPDVTAAPRVDGALRLLDLGCGRGEWLALLAEWGVEGVGVDRSAEMVRRCRAQGLAAVEADVSAYLRSLPDASLSGVSAFHVMEHVPLRTFNAWLAEIRRVLVPGGLVLVETPNPESLMTGASHFYLDPEHLRPVPMALARVVFELAGFERCELRGLHPATEAWLHHDDGPLERRFNEIVFGAQDYAVLAFAP